MQDIRDIVYDTLGLPSLRSSDILLCRKNEKEPFAKVISQGKTVLKVGRLEPEDYSGIVIRLSR